MTLHWVPDRGGAVAAMAALLRPGGMLGVLCFELGSDGEYRDLIAGLEPSVPRELVDAYPRMQVGEGELGAHVSAAGLEAVDVWTRCAGAHLPPERFLARKRATESALMPDLPDAEREAIWERIGDAVRAASGPEGFAYTFHKAYAVARRPI